MTHVAHVAGAGIQVEERPLGWKGVTYICRGLGFVGGLVCVAGLFTPLLFTIGFAAYLILR